EERPSPARAVRDGERGVEDRRRGGPPAESRRISCRTRDEGAGQEGRRERAVEGEESLPQSLHRKEEEQKRRAGSGFEQKKPQSPERHAARILAAPGYLPENARTCAAMRSMWSTRP